jgi:hypothetical protein
VRPVLHRGASARRDWCLAHYILMQQGLHRQPRVPFEKDAMIVRTCRVAMAIPSPQLGGNREESCPKHTTRNVRCYCMKFVPRYMVLEGTDLESTDDASFCIPPD